MTNSKVYIIDDDISVRRGLTRLIKSVGLHAISFESAADFLSSDESNKPGCIVLDVQMPGMTGPQLQDELGKKKNNIPIIFLTAHGDVPTATDAMKKRAVDFLTKPVDGDELIKAVHISLERDRINRKLAAENKTILEKLENLTSREYEVMTWVITGMLNKQIAGELDISEETVKIHRGRMMRKLDIVSVAELVRLCEKVGIRPAEKM